MLLCRPYVLGSTSRPTNALRAFAGSEAVEAKTARAEQIGRIRHDRHLGEGWILAEFGGHLAGVEAGDGTEVGGGDFGVGGVAELLEGDLELALVL